MRCGAYRVPVGKNTYRDRRTDEFARRHQIEGLRQQIALHSARRIRRTAMPLRLMDAVPIAEQPREYGVAPLRPSRHKHCFSLGTNTFSGVSSRANQI